MNSFKYEINSKFKSVDIKIKELKLKIETIKKKPRNIQHSKHTTIDHNSHETCCKNVHESDIGEGENALKNYINDLIKTFGLSFSVLNVDFIGSQNHPNNNFDQHSTRRKGPLLATFENETQRSELLKEKRCLKDYEQ